MLVEAEQGMTLRGARSFEGEDNTSSSQSVSQVQQEGEESKISIEPFELELRSSKDTLQTTVSFFSSFKEVLTGSKLCVLMLLSPFVLFGKGWSDGTIFVLSLLSIAPFAERLGFVTEQLAMHTNETLGGLLNATFGNATELIISMFALFKGKDDNGVEAKLYLRLVQVSLMGSVLSNLLLVLGSALAVGGMRFTEQRFNRMGVNVLLSLLTLVSLGLVSITLADQAHTSEQTSILSLSRVMSLVLVLVYALFLLFQLRTHRHYYEEEKNSRGSTTFELIRKTSDCEEESPRRSPKALEIEKEDVDEDELVLSFWTAMFWLGMISISISVLSEYLVDAIKGAATAWGVPEEFIAAILIPVVGNAAEHTSALVFAYKNRMDIALGIALGSASQIAVSVLPSCVLVGWAVGSPLTLALEPLEAGGLMLSVLLVSSCIRGGKSTWLSGVVLSAGYVCLAAAFWFHN